jgi:hypothetical protein
MKRANMSTVMPQGEDSLIVSHNGVLHKATETTWVGVNDKHKSVYKAKVEFNDKTPAFTKADWDAAKGLQA